MLKRISALLIASAALVGWLEDPAHSASGIWAEIDGWTIQAETDFMSCEAYARFNSGISLSFVYDGEDWLFSMIGRDVIPTFKYDARFIFDGQTQILGTMVAVTDRMMTVSASDEFMALIAKSYRLDVGDAYGFNLAGTAKALAETVTCQHTLQELIPATSSNPYLNDDVPEYAWGL